MADPSPSSEATGDGAGRAGPPAAPRWVKVFGLAAVAALVVAVVLMHTIGGGISGH